MQFVLGWHLQRNQPMKTFILQLKLLVLCCTSALSQNTSINQLDSLGKKHGKWEVYLTHQWKVVPDSVDAKYLWYTHYDHGTNLYLFGEWAVRFLKLTHDGSKETLVNGLKVMNGKYTWTTRSGRVISTHELKYGHYVLYEDFKTDGRLHTKIDYTQKLWEQPHTYKMTTWDRKGREEYFFHEKTKTKGWIAYQAVTQPDSISSKVLKISGDTVFTLERWFYYGKLYNEVEKVYFKGKGKGFFDGMFHGKYLAWYGNGNREHEGNYRFGQLETGWQSWEIDGTFRID